jgi:HEAT repeat protein
VAVAELVFRDERAVVESLLALLDDPAAPVVLAAIEVLDELWDYSLLPRFEALAHHPDTAVRDRAKQALLRLETVSAQSMEEPSVSPGHTATFTPAAEPEGAARERFAPDTD